MLARSSGSFVASVLSIPLLMVVSVRTLISLSGLLSIAAAVAACYVPEPVVVVNSAASDEVIDGGLVRWAPGAAGCAGCCGSGGGGGVMGAARRRVHSTWNVLKPCFTKQMGFAGLFLFCYRVVPTALVTYSTFTYSQFTLPNWAGGVLRTCALDRR
jgi:hypothetical protein